jgi:V8-like Glu-specific endopeptidase
MTPALPLRNAVHNATSDYKVRSLAWIARRSIWVPAAALITSSLMGCAAETSDSAVEAQVVTNTSDAKIFGGTKDDDGQAVAGVVALRVGTGSTFELCSGALIAPNVVLTARHCVTKNITNSVSCDENGRSANGSHVAGDEDAATIGVYTGAAPSFARPAVSSARAIVAPTGAYLCDSDIALVVLDTPILDVVPLPVRMNSPARAGELVRAVGYGQNDAGSPIGTRFRKNAVEVLAQGKTVSPNKTPLGVHEFEVGKSICQGDSGGPAISEETGAVIGVVSRGGKCDEDFGHIYTTTSGFDDLFAQAFKLANASPVLETGDINVNTRSQISGPKSSSPTDSSASSGSCSIGSGRGTGTAGTAGLGFVLAALGVLGLRRRRAV